MMGGRCNCDAHEPTTTNKKKPSISGPTGIFFGFFCAVQEQVLRRREDTGAGKAREQGRCVTRAGADPGGAQRVRKSRYRVELFGDQATLIHVGHHLFITGDATLLGAACSHLQCKQAAYSSRDPRVRTSRRAHGQERGQNTPSSFFFFQPLFSGAKGVLHRRDDALVEQSVI